MAIKQTFNDAPKLKITQDIDNVGLSNSEDGELYYDVANTALKLRATSGWHTFSED